MGYFRFVLLIKLNHVKDTTEVITDGRDVRRWDVPTNKITKRGDMTVYIRGSGGTKGE